MIVVQVCAKNKTTLLQSVKKFSLMKQYMKCYFNSTWSAFQDFEKDDHVFTGREPENILAFWYIVSLKYLQLQKYLHVELFLFSTCIWSEYVFHEKFKTSAANEAAFDLGFQLWPGETFI